MSETFQHVTGTEDLVDSVLIKSCDSSQFPLTKPGCLSHSNMGSAGSTSQEFTAKATLSAKNIQGTALCSAHYPRKTEKFLICNRLGRPDIWSLYTFGNAVMSSTEYHLFQVLQCWTMLLIFICGAWRLHIQLACLKNFWDVCLGRSPVLALVLTLCKWRLLGNSSPLYLAHKHQSQRGRLL